jgi:hypothetical protein
MDDDVTYAAVAVAEQEELRVPWYWIFPPGLAPETVALAGLIITVIILLGIIGVIVGVALLQPTTLPPTATEGHLVWQRQGNTCESSDDCGPGRACAFGQCLVSCANGTTSCPSEAPFCDAENGVCVECHGKEGCGSGICFQGRCVECTNDAHCSGNDALVFCDTKHHVCSAPCDDHQGGKVTGGQATGCPNSMVCATAGMCVGCRANHDCSGKKPYCDGSTATCVACLESEDCAGDSVCSSGVCVSSSCAAPGPNGAAAFQLRADDMCLSMDPTTSHVNLARCDVSSVAQWWVAQKGAATQAAPSGFAEWEAQLLSAPTSFSTQLSLQVPVARSTQARVASGTGVQVLTIRPSAAGFAIMKGAQRLAVKPGTGVFWSASSQTVFHAVYLGSSSCLL